MLRARAILALATLLALVLVRPIHWGVHALGGHAACHDGYATAAADALHEGCDHDHGVAASSEPIHEHGVAASSAPTHDHGVGAMSAPLHDHDGAPADRDDLADCELCLAIGLLATDVVSAPLHVLHAVPVGQPVPTSAALPTCRTEHAPLHARPPPASTT